MLSDSCCSTSGSHDDRTYVVKVVEIVEHRRLLLSYNTISQKGHVELHKHSRGYGIL